MGTPPNDGNKTVGYVDAYFDPGTGEVSLGTVTAIGIVIPKINIPIYNQGKNVRSRIQFNEPPVISNRFSDIHWQNIQHLLGLAATDESAGTQQVTDEDVGSPDITGGEDHEHGYWVSLAHGAGSESPISDVVVEPNGGGAAYTEGTDYIVDYAGGRLSFPNGSSIGDSVTLDVDYKYTTQDAKTIQITGGPIDTTGKFRGTHQFRDGRLFTCVIWKVNITGDFDATFVAQADAEAMTMPIEFSALEDPDHLDANSNPVFGYWTMETS